MHDIAGIGSALQYLENSPGITVITGPFFLDISNNSEAYQNKFYRSAQ